MSVEFVVAIPARHGSSRLPGKPLQPIGGEPMILRVAQRALRAGAAEVVVATDDERIVEALRNQPLRVLMTDPAHASGTDRLAECAERLGWPEQRIVVNLQGDEPFAPPQGIAAVADLLERSGADMATLCAPIESSEQLFDPNVVKLVRRGDGDALYFSRAPIPWNRDRFAHDRLAAPGAPAWRHIGIYAYRCGFLKHFARWPVSPLERIEALEQLRALEGGARIAVAPTPVPFPPGVDTADDLERARAHWAKQDG
jgi:3-deoxy-manno-octulosonate cytidylyltransferase (CMP-KDO synthetase)